MQLVSLRFWQLAGHYQPLMSFLFSTDYVRTANPESAYIKISSGGKNHKVRHN